MTLQYQRFLDLLRDNGAQDWPQRLHEPIAGGFSVKRYGDLPRWRAAVDQLPALKPSQIDLNAAAIRVGGAEQIDAAQRQTLREQLQALHPWRKGPFHLFGIDIDTEWRSDWKWERLAPHISPLRGRKVLDIGCGSGYHCWRMRGAGAELVMGIDPSPLFVMQYAALQHFIGDAHVAVLPIGVEHLPAATRYFDTVFSMGVLYHRRSPFDHLIQLRDTLRSGGELVLETLIVDGREGDTLVPRGRYGKMGNVWFIPSVATLEAWLEKVRFKNVRTVDINCTGTDEQRATEWMRFHSLADFLDPDDRRKTVEGYPAPQRAIVIAEAP